jgi:hypothetical protein
MYPRTPSLHDPAPGRPARGVPDVASELRRLMPRDRWLLDLLHEHQVLSTGQIAALGFTNIHTARNRLALLHARGIVARFRDAVRPGSQSWRWTLGLTGTAWIAARDGQPAPQPAAIRQRINRLAARPSLGHLIGVNGFFTDLAASARHTPGTELRTWWSEQRCRAIGGDLVRPDGHGIWAASGMAIGFWLEWDTGTEKRHQVAAKLAGYAALHQATGLEHTILFRLHSLAAETSLRQALARHTATGPGGLLIATTSQPGPAAPVWLALNAATRVRLDQLPGARRDQHQRQQAA